MTPPDASSDADDPPDPELAELVREFAANPPPPPCEAEWQRVQAEIAARLAFVVPPAPRRSSGSHRLKWVAAVGGLAAAVVVKFLAWPTPAPPPETALDPLAEYEVLPIATPSDVFVSAVRRDPDLGLVACDHPLPGLMRLASVTDLQVRPPQAVAVQVPAPAGDPPVFVMEPLDKDD